MICVGFNNVTDRQTDDKQTADTISRPAKNRDFRLIACFISEMIQHRTMQRE